VSRSWHRTPERVWHRAADGPRNLILRICTRRARRAKPEQGIPDGGGWKKLIRITGKYLDVFRHARGSYESMGEYRRKLEAESRRKVEDEEFLAAWKRYRLRK
jgi:hypothetical protein